MQIFTTGGMEDFTKCLGTSRTFSLICYIFWIFSTADGNIISQVTGSRVILRCYNQSLSTLTQLTWKKNQDILFSFKPNKSLHVGPEAQKLNIHLEPKSQPDSLIIERVQTSHTGNYTCEINTDVGPAEETWQLIITDPGPVEGENWNMIAIAVAVPCVCFLIFLIALMILLRVCKRRAENRAHHPTVYREQPEDIYENCLETDRSRRHGHYQPHQYKPTVH